MQMDGAPIGSLPLHRDAIMPGTDRGEDEDHGMGACPAPVEVLIIIPRKLDIARCGNQFCTCTFNDCTKQNAACYRAGAGREHDAGKIGDNAAVSLLLKTCRRLRGGHVVH